MSKNLVSLIMAVLVTGGTFLWASGPSPQAASSSASARVSGAIDIRELTSRAGALPVEQHDAF
jgi:hypothetical protein